MEATPVSDLLSLSPEDGQEKEDPVRRPTFVGLTGASILGAMFADPARKEPPVGGEPLAPVLTSHAPNTLPASPSIAALTAAVNNTWGAPRLPDSPSIRMGVWKGEVIASTEEELLSGIQG